MKANVRKAFTIGFVHRDWNWNPIEIKSCHKCATISFLFFFFVYQSHKNERRNDKTQSVVSTLHNYCEWIEFIGSICDVIRIDCIVYLPFVRFSKPVSNALKKKTAISKRLRTFEMSFSMHNTCLKSISNTH